MKPFCIRFYLLGSCLAACMALPALAQDSLGRMQRMAAATVRIDKILADYAAQNHLPALVWGLVANDSLVHASAMGFTEPDKKIRATPQSCFRIASMTKSFTAMAIVRLRDEGKLRLDDSVAKYIPEINNQPRLPANAPPVTIRHLLTHMAGFPEDNPWGDRQLAVTDADMLQMIGRGISFSNVPGVAYEYSNLGFAMLGYIIKKVSGMPYEEYIRLHILKPLGMTHTYWSYSQVPSSLLAHGYRWLNGGWVEQPMLESGAYGAMGGLITSLDDFARYMVLHLSAWPADRPATTGPVQGSTLREMQHAWNINQLVAGYHYPSGRACPFVTAYGYGLRWSKDCDGRVMVGHSGGLPGFGSDWKIMPEYGIGVVVFGNLTYAPASYLSTLVLDTLIAMAKLQPVPVPVTGVLAQRREALMKLLPGWDNAQGSGIFAENFFLDYFTDSLRAEATALFNKAGALVRVHDMVANNNLRGSFVIEGEKASLEVSFTLTPENPPLIQEYHIREIKR